MTEERDNRLGTSNHDRNATGMTYVYAVISRRAGGVSIGLNLNPNNACDWHCVYCQVPNLSRGVAPDIDLPGLRQELETMLTDIQYGDFMATRAPEHYRRLCDIAISGNGEPTSCKAIGAVIDIIVELMQTFGLHLPLRLISNGSYMHKPYVQNGLRTMALHGGETWIKVDSATDEGIRRINGVRLGEQRLRQQVRTAAALCPTWIQTCMFACDGLGPSNTEVSAYLDFLASLKNADIPVRGVMLYGLARPSMQEEALRLSALDIRHLESMAARISALGMDVQVTA